MIPNIKKYGKYAVIIIVGGLLILGYIFVTSWLKKKRVGDEGMSEGTEDLTSIIGEIGNEMDEANTQAKVEIAVARTEEKVTKEELKKVVAMKDKVERRKRLAAMHESVQ
jgi:hypothetical protein